MNGIYILEFEWNSVVFGYLLKRAFKLFVFFVGFLFFVDLVQSHQVTKTLFFSLFSRYVLKIVVFRYQHSVTPICIFALAIRISLCITTIHFRCTIPSYSNINTLISPTQRSELFAFYRVEVFLYRNSFSVDNNFEQRSSVSCLNTSATKS